MSHHWQQYRVPGERHPERNNLQAARDKIRDVRHKTKLSKKLLSSVSLPTFSRARLRHALGQSRRHFEIHDAWRGKRPPTEGDILLACLVFLVTKLKRREGRLRAMSGPRFRLYNEDRYSYEIVPVYADRQLWLALQARALELEVSLSYLADLALRLYLRRVLNRLLGQRDWQRLRARTVAGMGATADSRIKHGGKEWPSLQHSVGIDFLHHLLRSCSYKKNYTASRYGDPGKSRAGIFEARLFYVFGLKTAILT